MVKFSLKLPSSVACILFVLFAISFNAAAYGSSVEDLVGVFSIQKTIKIGSSSECFEEENVAIDPPDQLGIARAKDSQPPKLANFSLEPSSVKSVVSIQYLNLTAHIMDDYTGLSSGDKSNLSAAYFHSPSGRQTVNAVFFPDNLSSGSNLNGIYTSKVILPPDSEPGIWQLSNFTLIDGQGNCRVQSRNDLAALGFPVQFLVT